MTDRPMDEARLAEIEAKPWTLRHEDFGTIEEHEREIASLAREVRACRTTIASMQEDNARLGDEVRRLRAVLERIAACYDTDGLARALLEGRTA